MDVAVAKLSKFVESKITKDDDAVAGAMKSLRNFTEDKLCLTPSFLKFLVYLRKSKIEFGLLFRTFGRDFPLVSKELNYFVTGKHPMFNGKNGTNLI